MALQETKFEIIGTETAPIQVRSFAQCLELANIILLMGLHNYKQARIPIKSDLNIEAGEYHVKNYPDYKG